MKRAAMVLLAGLLSGSPLAAFADSAAEAVTWLQKMSHAVRNESYQGIFSYIRGSTFNTVKIVHAMENGVETERLINLNGDVRELYRQGTEILCYHPTNQQHSEETLADHTVQIGPFTSAFTERVLATQHNYRLAMHDEDRIAGRTAVTLTVSPRFNDRYGYRLWLDQETGLLLQSHLVERGRVREIFQFTSLEIGEQISPQDLASAINGETMSHPLSLESAERTEKPVWRVAWLPDGFRPVRVSGNRLHFSDGLANFSVFVETSGAAAMPDLTTTVGGTVVITRRLKNSGPQITVVGEVPVPMARRVAESVEPVIY